MRLETLLDELWPNAHDGKVNIVEQIERFYAKYLPLSREMAKNLQSFGEE